MTKTLDGIKNIEQFQLEDKRLFLRLDLNVPLDENGKISDGKRAVRAALPTIRYAIDKAARRLFSLRTSAGRRRRKTARRTRSSPLLIVSTKFWIKKSCSSKSRGATPPRPCSPA